MNPIERLRLLAKLLEMLVVPRARLLAQKNALNLQFPTAAAQINTLFGPLETEFAATETRVRNALAAIAPTNAEKVAYADAHITATKAGTLP